MQKYAIILIILLLVGIGLSVRFFTQDEKLDQTQPSRFETYKPWTKI